MSEKEAVSELRDPVVIEPRPSRTGPSVKEPVVLCPVGPVLEMAARLYKARRRIRKLDAAALYTAGTPAGKVTLCGPCVGAPAAVYLLERLIASGARQVVMVGLCGSVSSEVRIGGLVVPDRALIEEGTSRHYKKGEKFSAPSAHALASLRQALDRSGRGYHLGPAWTTDAVFRETAAKVENYGKRGILAVEMEASALFTVAAYRGVDLAALLVTSDELFDLRWRRGFTRRKFLAACRHAFRIGLDAALIMSGRDGLPAEQLEEEPEAEEE